MNRQARKVKFQSMSAGEQEQWYLLMVQEDAEDLVKSGREIAANAVESADRQTRQMLKDGLETENNHLYIAQDADSGYISLTVFIGIESVAFCHISWLYIIFSLPIPFSPIHPGSP